MLALSRKKNEAIIINNDIEITVLEVKGDQVKIGISAPKEVPIYLQGSIPTDPGSQQGFGGC